MNTKFNKHEIKIYSLYLQTLADTIMFLLTAKVFILLW